MQLQHSLWSVLMFNVEKDLFAWQRELFQALMEPGVRRRLVVPFKDYGRADRKVAYFKQVMAVDVGRPGGDRTTGEIYFTPRSSGPSPR